MIKIAFRIALTALIFTFIFPMISGVHFTGEFWPQGIAYGLLMAAVAYLFTYVVGLFIVATLGIGAIFVLFGFWLIPAIELQILAHFFPQNLAFDSWGSAILAGLLLMVVNIFTTIRSTQSTNQR
ncbi:MAG: hypothetical protein KGS72_28890 [Cyanobacteria bacterium REEB67]|nr:hypothetical protein [Cyanobacteria bacterium REEB67]